MAKGEHPVQKSGHTKGKQLGIDGSYKGQDGDVSKGGGAKTVTNANRKKYGRNLSRAKNQGGK